MPIRRRSSASSCCSSWSAASVVDFGCGSGVLVDRGCEARIRAGDRPRRRRGGGCGDAFANAAANGVEIDARQATRSTDELPPRRCAVANIDAADARSRRLHRASTCERARDVGLLRSRPAGASRLRTVASRADGRAGPPSLFSASAVASAPMTTFSVRFLGCKVSHTDAQEIRERLLARRPCRARTSGADVAVVNTCCVTHEAVRKSRQAAARAARTHRRVYVTGLRARTSPATRSPGCRRTSSSSRGRARRRPAFVAGDVGAIGCVQADARLDRVRAFVKVQDGCSFSCNFCVIPLVRGAVAQPLRGGRARRGAPPRRAGAPRDRPHRDQPRLLSRPRRRLHAAAARPRGRRDRRGSSACASRRSRSTTSTTSSSRALRETPTVSQHLHVPLQSGDDGVLRDMARRYTAATYLRRLEPLAGLQPDDRRDRRLPDRDRARVPEHALRSSRRRASRKSTSSRTRRDREQLRRQTTLSPLP